MTRKEAICHRYLDHARAAWQEARRNQPDIQRRYYQWGTHTVGVEFAGPALVRLLTRALAHREVSPVSAPSLTIRAWDTDSTRTEFLPGDAPATNFVGADDADDFRVGICRDGETVYLWDQEDHHGYFWTRTPASLPLWEESGPFRLLLHWWWRSQGFQILHAAAVGRDGQGVLLTGKGGSGKSTTAFACLRAGMDFLGEDYCLVRATPIAEAASLYSTGKLTEDARARFPELDEMLADLSDCKPLASGKRLYFLEPGFSSRIKKKLVLKGILIPEVTGRKASGLEPTSKGHGLRSLAPSTLVHHPLSGSRDMSHMAQLIERLPVFRLKLGLDLAGIAVEIAKFLAV